VIFIPPEFTFTCRLVNALNLDTIPRENPVTHIEAGGSSICSSGSSCGISDRALWPKTDDPGNWDNEKQINAPSAALNAKDEKAR